MNIKTSCKKCIFGLWSNTNGMRDQVGCYFDRLEKFKQVGVKVEHEENHFIIDRLCNRCFHTDGSLSLEEYAKLAVERTKLKVDMIISPYSNHALNDFISDFKRLNPQPNKLIILDRVKSKASFLNTLQDSHLPKWELIAEVEKVPDLDNGIDKIESPYFWIPDYYDNINRPEDNLLQLVDDFYNEKMQDFYLLYGDNGVLVNFEAYRMFVNKSEDMVKSFLSINEKFELDLPRKCFTWNDLQ